MQIDRIKEEMVCDIKSSGETFIRMMSCLKKVIYRGWKMNPPGFFDKYDEYNSGSIKAFNKLRRQLKILIKVFLSFYQDIIIKNNGKYSFPQNFSKEKVLKLIDKFKTMAINNNTGVDIYIRAIECIIKGDHNKVYLLLPNTDINNGLVSWTTNPKFHQKMEKWLKQLKKAKKEFRKKGEINNIVEIDDNKINYIINADQINEVHRYFK